MKVTPASSNVFKDLGFSDADSEKLKIKATLMVAIEKYIIEHGLTQQKAAGLLKVTRPRVSDLMRGQIDKFTIDALIDMLERLHFHVKLSIVEQAA